MRFDPNFVWLGGPFKGVTLLDRLLSSRTVTPHGCWEWSEGLFAGRYGQLRYGKLKVKVHRVSYSVFNEADVPDDMFVCHRCDNVRCFNPDHLFLGSALDNNRDMIAKGRARYPSGEACAQSKLTDAQAAQIRKLAAEGQMLQREIARLFGVSKSRVQQLKR